MSRIKTVLLNPLLTLFIATSIWIWSLNFFDLSAMKDWGLVSIYPIHIIVAYLILILSFSRLLIKEKTNDIIFFLHTVLLILMIHGTPHLLYKTLRYSWAWKHVGIVDYIIRHGSVDPTLEFLSAYHNWPGFFSVSALFTELAGFPSALKFAGWGAVFFEILFALGLRSLFYLFTKSRKLQWLGVWFFLATNWVGQDYFSPQAMSYFMLPGFLIFVLRYFGPKEPGNPAIRLSDIKIKLLQPIARWLDKLKITCVYQYNSSRQTNAWALGVLVLIIFLMIVSTHQLTPNIGTATILILVFLGYTRWRTLPLWMLGISIFWLLFPARPYSGEVIESFFESYGQLVSNVEAGLINVGTVSIGQALVSLIGRVLTVLVGILAALGAYRRLLHGYLDLPIIMLAVAPALVIFVNAYGGEAIFRTYFFSIPYLSFLLAGIFLPDDRKNIKTPVAIWFIFVSMVLITGTLFAYSGKDQQYYFTKDEVAAADYLYSHSEPNSLLIEGSRNYPSQFKNYENFTYIAIDREPIEDRVDIINNPEAVLYRWTDNPDYDAFYIFISRSQKIATDTLGTLPIGSLEDVQKSLENSAVFNILYSNQDAIIFVPKRGR